MDFFVEFSEHNRYIYIPYILSIITMEKNSQTTMKISREFLKFLDKQIIHKSESYEDIIKRLLRAKVLDKATQKEIKLAYEHSL